MAKKRRKSSLILISLVLISLFTYDYFADGKLKNSISEYFSGDKQKSKRPKRKSRSKKKGKESSPKSPVSYEEMKGEFYNVYFSQVYEGDPKIAERNPNSMDRKVAQVIKRAKKQVYAALHELDSKIITDAILYVYKNGVEVKIVTEDKYKDEESIRRLRRVGIPVVDDSSGPKGKLMHNKFIIIDVVDSNIKQFVSFRVHAVNRYSNPINRLEGQAFRQLGRGIYLIDLHFSPCVLLCSKRKNILIKSQRKDSHKNPKPKGWHEYLEKAYPTGSHSYDFAVIGKTSDS